MLAVAAAGCTAPNVTLSLAQISASPALLDFGSIAVGASASGEVTIANTGGTSLNIASMSVTGPNAAALSCIGCAARQLGGGEQVKVTIRFAPGDASPTVGRLVVVSDAANSPELLVSLAGNSSCTAETDAAFCQRLGRTCGQVVAPDTCGTKRTVASCGVCQSGTACGASNVCGCVPETDAELCVQKGAVCGSLSVVDRCGATRSISSCGTCDSQQSCTAGACTCAPETDEAMCARLNKNCGAVTDSDNCGFSRSIASCGVCGGVTTCGASNVCGCVAETDAEVCAAKGFVCGALNTTDHCGSTRHIASCGGCGTNQTCGGGGTAGACGCTPETDAAMCSRLGKGCGSFSGSDNCGIARSIASCGTCTAAPAHASPLCSATNACDFVCVSGYARAGSSCVPSCTGASLTNAPFAGGSGTFQDPYFICTVAQFDRVRDVAAASKVFTLLADLDLSSVSFEPIGDATTHVFNGDFMGGGFSISNWHYTAPSTDYVGLFSRFNSGTVSGLKLVAFDVTGRDNVGALAGTLGSGSIFSDITVSGTISGHDLVGALIGQSSGTTTGIISTANVAGHSLVGGLIGYMTGRASASSSSGTVTGTGTSTGGLMGALHEGSDLALNTSFATGPVSGVNQVGGLVGTTYLSNTGLGNSYATGKVTGTTQVGGLVGSNNVPIVNSYSTGAVAGTSSVGGLVGANNSLIGHAYSIGAVTGSSQVGGLVGSNSTSPMAVAADAFWDTSTSGQSTSAVGIGKTTAQLQSAATFSTWNTYTLWKLGNGYPTFVTTPAACTVGATAFAGGSGTLANPYLINQPAQLYHLSCNLSAAFKLTADLDFAGQPMVPPIGTLSQGFQGNFDGNGKTISNWVAYGGAVGLFMANSGQVHDLTVANAEVGGSVLVSAVVGSNSGTLTKLRSSGVVRGVYVVGGVVANHTGGKLSQSSSSASVFAGTGNGGASAYSGGLVGYGGSPVSNCYATGTVTSLDLAAGGLVGDNVGASAVVTNSYSTGLVTKGSGFAAGNTSSAVNCFWDTETSGQTTSSYGTGKTTAQMKDQTTYTGWDFSSIWQISPGNYPTLR